MAGAPGGTAPGGMPGLGEMLMKGELMVAPGANAPAPGTPGLPSGSAIAGGSGPMGSAGSFGPPPTSMGPGGMSGVPGMPGGGVPNPFSIGPITGPVFAYNPMGAPTGDHPMMNPLGPMLPPPDAMLPPPPGYDSTLGQPIYPVSPNLQCPPTCDPGSTATNGGGTTAAAGTTTGVSILIQ